MKKLLSVVMFALLLGGCAPKEHSISFSEPQSPLEIDTPKKLVTVTNPVPLARSSETISLDWKTVKKSIPGLTAGNVAVYDIVAEKYLMTQVYTEDNTAQLLFQTDLAPDETKEFYVMVHPGGIDKPTSPLTTYCRFIPERSDDFGWENDKAAYRMYGPALEWETITSGIDAWGKSVPYPVIDKMIWNTNNRGIPYHEDHGEGGDFYKVGNTLGDGGMAPFIGDKVCLPRNFVNWNIIANGPIRSTFELTYNAWEAGGYTVSEIKKISIDLGSNMNRIECLYSSDDTDEIPLAAGIILRDTSDQTWTSYHAIAYWLPTDTVTGMFGCGVVFSSEYEPTLFRTGGTIDEKYVPEVVRADSHLLLKLDQKIGEPVVYYAGSCWDKNEEFNTFKKWQDYLNKFRACLDNPVSVTISKVK